MVQFVMGLWFVMGSYQVRGLFIVVISHDQKELFGVVYEGLQPGSYDS